MKPKMTYRSHIRVVLTLGLPLISGYLGGIVIQTTNSVMSRRVSGSLLRQVRIWMRVVAGTAPRGPYRGVRFA